MTDIKRPFFLQLSNPRQHNHLSRNDNDDDFAQQQRHKNQIDICDNEDNDSSPGLVAKRPSKLRLTREKRHNNQFESNQQVSEIRRAIDSDVNSCDDDEHFAKSGSSSWPCQDRRSNQLSTDSASSHNISRGRQQTSLKRSSKCKTSSSIDCDYNSSYSTSLKKNRYSANSVSSITSSSASSEFSSPNLSPAMSPTSSTSNDSPSLILPYLYVGDQDQTQIDTISNLNISYILSLQSLPKFLAKHEPDSHSKDSPDSNIDTADVEVEAADTAGNTSHSGLLPSINSSKDYLVKIKSPSLESSNADGSMDVDEKEADVGEPSEANVKMSQNCVESNQEQSHSSVNNDKNASNKQLESKCPAISAQQSMIASTSQALTGRCNKISSKVQRLIRGKCINISDTFEQLLDKFFDEAHNFIEEARRNRCNILVHCKAGISRSPTIAIAYLMKWKRLHLQEAYNLVKRCRPQISPNLNFMGQLVSYERYLLCGKSKLTSPVPTQCPSPKENISSEEDQRKAYRPSETVRIAA